MTDGFIKVAAASNRVWLNDIDRTADEIIEAMEKADQNRVKVCCFQEMALTGYSLQDLFRQPTVQQAVEAGLKKICEETQNLDMLTAIGIPFLHKNKIYNAAAVIFRGEVLCIITKSHLPTYDEFYDGRYFAPSMKENETAVVFGKEVPIGPKILIECENVEDLTIGVEICEDGWIANNPSAQACLNGATIILNPSASNETVGKAAYRRQLFGAISAKQLCGYVYSNCSEGESSSDMVYSGHSFIFDNGTLRAEKNDFRSGMIEGIVDVQALSYQRRKKNTFDYLSDKSYETIRFSFNTVEDTELPVLIPSYPFIPSDPQKRKEDMDFAFSLQVHGLMRRIEALNLKSVVLGVSGGLDSALALLVCHQAFANLNIPFEGIHAFSMPAFATTSRTKSNSETLCNSLGVSFREVPIGQTTLSHLKDLGHSKDQYDTTYENAQARGRTYLLMDASNMYRGIVVGTGDLSEIALGWSTYNGDQMSMYNVNASIPKTMVRAIVAQWADENEERYPVAAKTLRDIIDTPISPELVPSKGDQIGQVTEDIIGPYELHDFFIWCFTRLGYGPRKLFRAACESFSGLHSPKEICKWLRVFFRRFFASQFKRSAAPDGPKVTAVSLGQRADWRMVSDLGSRTFMDQIDEIEKDL